jgi:hypothetical protein
MGVILITKHPDGETRAAAYETVALAKTALNFQLDIHRHLGHEIREEGERFQALDISGHIVREFQILAERRRRNRGSIRSECAR